MKSGLNLVKITKMGNSGFKTFGMYGFDPLFLNVYKNKRKEIREISVWTLIDGWHRQDKRNPDRIIPKELQEMLQAICDSKMGAFRRDCVPFTYYCDHVKFDSYRREWGNESENMTFVCLITDEMYEEIHNIIQQDREKFDKEQQVKLHVQKEQHDFLNKEVMQKFRNLEKRS